MEFTKDMQIIAEVLGDDAAMKLMKDAGGLYLYIPKPDNKSFVMEHLRQNGFNTKLVAVQLNICQKTVERVYREYKRGLNNEKMPCRRANHPDR